MGKQARYLCRPCRHGKPGCKGLSYRRHGCANAQAKTKTSNPILHDAPVPMPVPVLDLDGVDPPDATHLHLV